MKQLAFIFVASLMVNVNAFAQSPLAVKYCRDLAATYRKAVSAERPADPDVSRASVNCQTNPDNSIPLIEAGLKLWKIDLPAK